MKADPIRGETIRWTFSDGLMANKTFEHTFEKDGAVTWRELDGKTGEAKGKPTRAEKSEVVQVGEDVYAVSSLASSGYTLTVVLDFRSGNLVAFASNEKELTVQNGTFEAAETTLSTMGLPHGGIAQLP